MMTAKKNHPQWQLMAVVTAIVLFCASAATIIAAWAPGANGLPADISAIQNSR